MISIVSRYYNDKPDEINGFIGFSFCKQHTFISYQAFCTVEVKPRILIEWNEVLPLYNSLILL